MMQSVTPRRKLITIICPVFNEEECIPIFYSRLQNVLATLRNRYDFELFFVNNRSVDKTLDTLLSLREKDPALNIITMSRNFGYQASLLAGMKHASGDGVLAIDVDCEDPPELIPKFLAVWEEGYDIVHGIRGDRPEWWIIKKTRNFFYHLLRMSADMDIILYMAEFALISSHVRAAIINNQNTYPFLRAEIGYVGFSRSGVSYDRQPRVKGKTHYNLFGMVAFAVGGLLTSSTVLMRLAAYFFPVVALFNVVLFATDLFQVSTSSVFFKALVSFDLTYGIFLLTMHGVYLARIYKNAIGRPVFIIDPKYTYIEGKGTSQSKPLET